MRIYLLVLAIIIIALGITIPELSKRRLYAKFKKRGGSDVTLADILLAIERVRRDMWQVEAIFFGLLLAILFLLH